MKLNYNAANYSELKDVRLDKKVA